MWTGGVRVIVLDENKRMLLVKHCHDERDVWMVPGGGIEEGEYAVDAAFREMKEETGLELESCIMICHIEEVSARGQRFVNIFLGQLADGQIQPELGYDPEFDEEHQVLKDIKFMTKEEIQNHDAIYPEYLKESFWEELESGQLGYDAFRKRNDSILFKK